MAMVDFERRRAAVGQDAPTCAVCGEPRHEGWRHYEAHTFPVVDERGEPAAAFRCRCGDSERCWGWGRDEATARARAAAALADHLLEHHGVPL